MRNMSFSMTTEAVRRKDKTVTRRLGWWFLEPGDLLQPVEKAQGLKKGEHVVKIGGPIRVLSTTPEQLANIACDDVYGPDELAAEGFPDMTGDDFLDMFMRHNGCDLYEQVNRIEFEYVEQHVDPTQSPAGG